MNEVGVTRSEPLDRRARADQPERGAIVHVEVSDVIDIVDEWGRQSFPASDPPANW